MGVSVKKQLIVTHNFLFEIICKEGESIMKNLYYVVFQIIIILLYILPPF